MVQLANAVRGGFDKIDTRSEHNYIGALSPLHRSGWCEDFTRPEILHIRPTGNVGNCMYAYAIPEEFGNLGEHSMAAIVNGIQNTRVSQMFRDGSIERYQHELDKSLLFPKRLGACEQIVLRLAYGVIKERLEEQGVEDPEQRASLEVARMYGFSE
tara:strand:+ start:711 stop:1178 length:468 start_codon:yes stop_codon:yes gene_type:complete